VVTRVEQTPSQEYEHASVTQRCLRPGVDFWGLGVLLAEMVTGQPPFRADDPLELAKKICDNDEPPDLGGVTDEKCLAVLRALLNKRDPPARRADASSIEWFGDDDWRASLITAPPPFSADEGYMDWFEDEPEAPEPGAADPWADF